MPYTCSTSLGPEAIYGMAVILVVGLIYFIFPVVHTVQPELMGVGVGWGGRVQSWMLCEASTSVVTNVSFHFPSVKLSLLIRWHWNGHGHFSEF